MQEQFLSQLKGSPEVVKFLLWWADKQWRDNIFTANYGADRALKDGRAKLAEEFYDLIEGLTSD